MIHDNATIALTTHTKVDGGVTLTQIMAIDDMPQYAVTGGELGGWTDARPGHDPNSSDIIGNCWIDAESTVVRSHLRASAVFASQIEDSALNASAVYRSRTTDSTFEHASVEDSHVDCSKLQYTQATSSYLQAFCAHESQITLSSITAASAFHSVLHDLDVYTGASFDRARVMRNTDWATFGLIDDTFVTVYPGNDPNRTVRACSGGWVGAAGELRDELLRLHDQLPEGADRLGWLLNAHTIIEAVNRFASNRFAI